MNKDRWLDVRENIKNQFEVEYQGEEELVGEPGGNEYSGAFREISLLAASLYSAGTFGYVEENLDRKSTRLNSSHT